MDCICSIRDLKTFRRGDSPFGLRALGDPTVNAMMWDAEGTLWVMTNSGGVSYMTKQLKRFDYYSLISLSGTLELGREIALFVKTRMEISGWEPGTGYVFSIHKFIHFRSIL